ncbi:MAG: LytR C-terminal domain-containing protein [Fidelibacterota bacterium]
MRLNLQGSVLNAGIAFMSLLLIAFILSFSGRQTQTGIPIEVKFPSLPDSPKLAAEIYDENPLLDVEVEILNGCGEPGLAAKFAEYLRSKRVDVVRSDNADHFDYPKTILIQRNENVEGLKIVANALGFDIKDPDRVLTKIDPSMDADITLIIGKDYHSIAFDSY